MKVNSRLKKLRQRLDDKGIDAIFISQPENRYYLSGFDGSYGFLLITAPKAVLATDFRYLEQAGAQSPEYEIFRITNNISDWFPGLVGDAGVRHLKITERLNLLNVLKEKICRCKIMMKKCVSWVDLLLCIAI